MRTTIEMPDIGTESATVSAWFVELGDVVEEGERLLEVLAGAATFAIAAPASGILVLRCALPPDRVLPGQMLGHIEDVIVPN